MVAAASTLVAAAVTSAAGWLSPRAQAALQGPLELRIWEATALLAITLFLGAATGLWIGYRKGSASSAPVVRNSASPPGSEGRTALSPAFYPRPLHDHCIRALRFKDNEYQSVNGIAEHLASIGVPTPKSDIEQVLAELVEHEWVSNQINVQTGWEYKLIGGGVAYARDCGFPVKGHLRGTRSTNRPSSVHRRLE